MVSVIVPTLNEERVLAATLQGARQPGVHEIIVADGGSTDATCAIAQQLADRLVTAPRGRAVQMNAGAAQARSDVLLFLHADTLVPDNFAGVVGEACAQPGVIGGRFDVILEPSTALVRLTGTLINWRSRCTRVATGDQAIFIRRDAFEHLGGFSDIPLMEDIELSRRMKRAGTVVCLRERVTTSARRWQQDGTVRTILLMWSLRLLYYCGMSPQRLHARYRDTR